MYEAAHCKLGLSDDFLVHVSEDARHISASIFGIGLRVTDSRQPFLHSDGGERCGRLGGGRDVRLSQRAW
jgi:hypothetical protein